MESLVELAMMTKAKMVFETPDTFVSFPLTPFVYPPERLDFMQKGVATNEDLMMLSEFSRLVNRIPGGVILELGEDIYLWEVYADVLNAAELAKGLRTSEEEATYQQALKFLYRPTAAGIREDSPALTAYRQYRDCHIRALEEYKNQKFTAEASTDIEIQKHWSEVEEPFFRKNIQAIEDEWRSSGRKNEVEAALRIEDTLGKKSPETTWQGWRTGFNPHLDMLTDTTNQRFALCGYSPYDVINFQEWPKFALTGPEVEALINASPLDLKNRLAPNPIKLEIERLSFEYASVAVTRSWLNSGVFKAKFWRLPPQSQFLCDGLTPPQGRCTSYITALILARNINLKLKANSPSNISTLDRLSAVENLKLANFVFSRADLTNSLTANKVAKPVRFLGTGGAPVKLFQPQLGRAGVGNKRIIPSTPQTASLRVVGPGRNRTIIPEGGAKIPVMAHARLQSQAFQAAHLFPLPVAKVLAVKTETAVAAEMVTKKETKPTILHEIKSEIYIIGFICKRLPKCPDPDPEMQW